MSMCSGPFLPTVMYGSSMLVCVMADSSIFAFSAASRMRCIAAASRERSILFSFLNSCTR